MARAVEITDGPYTDQGVLLIDLRYNSLEQLFDGMNLAKGGYVYLTDSNGDLIYHPNGQLISSGLAMENNDNTAILRDGNYQEQWQGQTWVVSIKTVGYTGWKIVGVMPLDTVSLNAIKTTYFDRVYYCTGVVYSDHHQLLYFFPYYRPH